MRIMAEIGQFSDTQAECFFEDWDAAEPKTTESTVFGVSTTDLFSRYSYYTRLVKERTKWEEESSSNHFVDFKSILSGQKAQVDPEHQVRIFVNEKLSNGQLLRLTQNPTPEKAARVSANSSIEEVDELEIPVHVINKRSFTPADPPNFKKPPEIAACLPLLIEDILRIDVQKDAFDKFELFDQRFRLVTFYGRICGVRRNEKCSQRIGVYEVDDGTGRITVHYNHLKKEYKECFFDIENLERRMRLRRNKLQSKCGPISADIKKLLELSRTQLRLQINYFSLGDRAMVLGVPFRVAKDSEVRIFGYEMYAHSHSHCDFEIYFKDLLFNAYCGTYLANKIESAS